MQVSKNTENSSTSTQINELDSKQRIEEVSRMLGGINITKQTIAHAKEMLDSAQKISA